MMNKETIDLLNIKLLGKRFPYIDDHGKVSILIEFEGKYYLENYNQPERSKREDLQDILYCNVRCAEEGNGIFEGPCIMDFNYCQKVKCANYCFANQSCEMRCSEHCGNTVRDK